VKQPVIAVYVGLTLSGFGLGVIEAGKWLHALSVPRSELSNIGALIRTAVWIPAAMLVLGVLLAGYATARFSDPKRSSLLILKVSIAIITALASCWIILKLSRVFYLAPAAYIPVFASALVAAVGLLSYLSTPLSYRSLRESALRGLVAGALWTSLILLLRAASDGSARYTVGGFGTFAALFDPPQLREYHLFIRDLAGGALFGSVAGTIAGMLLPRYRAVTGMAWGMLLGVWISGVLFAAHSLTGVLIMQTAYNARVACYSSIVLVACAGVLIAMSIVMIVPGLVGRAHKATAIAIIVPILVATAWYVNNSRRGSELYLAALKIRADKSREYIHYKHDGSWTRTFEPHSDSAKIFLCDRLLRDYPNCIYTAQAMYLKAKCQYATWQYDEAAQTLELLCKRYRDFRGSSSLLLAHAYLSTGRFEKVVRTQDWSDPIFTQWRLGDGRLLLGHAYEVTGNNLAARSRYSDYINALSSTPVGRRSIWTAPAIQYAESRFDKVLSPSTVKTSRGNVRGRVLCDDKPLAGVYVALVQPHIDGSSPEDTTQFTGALTVPLWFGIGATTDGDGCFSMQDVPYGRYEAVIGFETRCIPSNRVISSSV
jgi:hypothetical protein